MVIPGDAEEAVDLVMRASGLVTGLECVINRANGEIVAFASVTANERLWT